MKRQPAANASFYDGRKKFCVEPLSPLYSTEVPARYSNKDSKKNSSKRKHAGEEGKSLSPASLGPVTGRFANVPFVNVLH